MSSLKWGILLSSLFICIILSSCVGNKSSDNNTKQYTTNNINPEDSFVVNKRLLDSLEAYMAREDAALESNPLILRYYIAFDKQNDSNILVTFYVSNVDYVAEDKIKEEFVGFFIYNKRKISILDKIPPIADILYNKKNLKEYVEPLGEEPPGSGYVGERLEFVW